MPDHLSSVALVVPMLWAGWTAGTVLSRRRSRWPLTLVFRPLDPSNKLHQLRFFFVLSGSVALCLYVQFAHPDLTFATPLIALVGSTIAGDSFAMTHGSSVL